MRDQTELLQLLLEQQQRNTAQQETILNLAEQIKQMQQRIDKLLQLLYGVKSEKKKLPSKPDVPLASNAALVNPTNASQSKSNTNPNGRRTMPADFPVPVFALSMICLQKSKAVHVVHLKCSAWAR